MVDWNLVGYVFNSKYRILVLRNLMDGYKSNKQLTEMTGLYNSHVSRTLRELEEKELVKCLNPELTQGKIYSITESGKKVLEKLPKDYF